jgi:glycogenin glucosyltransferase
VTVWQERICRSHGKSIGAATIWVGRQTLCSVALLIDTKDFTSNFAQQISNVEIAVKEEVCNRSNRSRPVMEWELLWYQIPPIVTLIATLSGIVFLHLHPVDPCPAPPVPPSERAPRQAFATLTTPAFAMGAVTLGYTLQKHHGEKYDRVCLISSDVNETWRKILSQWWILKPVVEYKPMVHFRRSWNKFWMWNMTEYTKIVYLDTDTLVIRPIDRLFDYPQLSCACDPNPPQICNTGVLVLEPGDGIFEAMDQLGRVEAVRRGIGDQSSINAYFRNFTPIPPAYNAARTLESGLGDLMRRGTLRVIHFVCKKPWKCGREGISYSGCAYPELNQVWWDTWDEACEGRLCLESWAEAKATKKPTAKK